MHRFDWVEPRSLEEAHAALREHGDDAKLMAGGTALMLLMRQGLVQPGVIVSLQRVPGLDQIAARDGGIRIGALCTHRRVETHPLVRERFPALHETLERVATIRIRNMGTIGGNLAHSDPAQDPPPTLLALGASVQVAGPDGARSIPLDEFFTDYYENALRPGEVLTAIEVPDQAGSFNGSGPAGARYVQAFSKFLPRSVDDYATVAVAVSMAISGPADRPTPPAPPPDAGRGADAGARGAASLSGEWRCEDVRIGLGSAGPTPLRARGAEAALRGQALTAATLREAGEAAAAECDPLADVRGSAEYKREMVKVWLARTVRRALERRD
ncbi:MAG TPA: xanthine dehydrogenase family protein subunit M [Chloroflexota bacterium]|nr:xanthine dehydrogenase family protein subunit M [Chloroflexota bacterium]